MQTFVYYYYISGIKFQNECDFHDNFLQDDLRWSKERLKLEWRKNIMVNHMTNDMFNYMSKNDDVHVYIVFWEWPCVLVYGLSRCLCAAVRHS